jgi:hypothetical protein
MRMALPSIAEIMLPELAALHGLPWSRRILVLVWLVALGGWWTIMAGRDGGNVAKSGEPFQVREKRMFDFYA